MKHKELDGGGGANLSIEEGAGRELLGGSYKSVVGFFTSQNFLQKSCSDNSIEIDCNYKINNDDLNDNNDNNCSNNENNSLEADDAHKYVVGGEETGMCFVCVPRMIARVVWL